MLAGAQRRRRRRCRRRRRSRARPCPAAARSPPGSARNLVRPVSTMCTEASSLLVEQLERADHALGGELHLRAPVRHRAAHRAAAVHDACSSPCDARAAPREPPATPAAGLPRATCGSRLRRSCAAARHHQAAARLLHVLREHVAARPQTARGAPRSPAPPRPRRRARRGSAGTAPAPSARGPPARASSPACRSACGEQQHPRRALHAHHRPADVVLDHAVARRLDLQLGTREARLVDQVTEGEQVGLRA